MVLIKVKMFKNYATETPNGQGNGLGIMIPAGIHQANPPILAKDSEAYNCFTNQAFSLKLQGYLINYVIATNSYYPLYA